MNQSDNKPKENSNPASVHTLLKAQTDYQQSINKRFDQLEAGLKQTSAGFGQQLQTGLKENQRLVNSIKEDNASLGEQINYIEKKIDYVDKTLDLRIRHFDEILKNSQEQYEKNVKDIESQIRYQGERLSGMETKVSSIKYWYIGVGMIIVGLIWVSIAQLTGADKLFMSEMNKSDNKFAYSMQRNFKEILQTLHQDNNDLSESIKKEHQQILTATQKTYRQQLSGLRKENKALLQQQQEENQQFLSDLQQLTREQLATLVELLQPEASYTPAPEPTPDEQLDGTEAIEPDE